MTDETNEAPKPKKKSSKKAAKKAPEMPRNAKARELEITAEDAKRDPTMKAAKVIKYAEAKAQKGEPIELERAEYDEAMSVLRKANPSACLPVDGKPALFGAKVTLS